MSRGMKHLSGSGSSRTLKSVKIEIYKLLRRKGFSESDARYVLKLTKPIPQRAFKRLRHNTFHKHGVVGAAIAETKRERILAERRS